MNTALLLGRIVLGAYFVYAGAQHFLKIDGMTEYAASKHIPLPRAAVALTGLVLLLGGLGVLFQNHLLWAYEGLIAFLVLAAFLMHAFWSDTDPQTKMVNQIQFQKNLALAAALLLLAAPLL